MEIKTKIKMMVMGAGLVLALTPAAQAQESQAGFFVEPGITYDSGDHSINYSSPLSNSTGRIDGLGLSARLGMHIQEAFFLALDGRYAIPQFKDSSVNYDARSVATNWGAVVGVQMPNVGLRVWGSYVLGGELNPEQSGNFDLKFQDASGYRIGAGFRLASISLNLEYETIKYGKTILEQPGLFASNGTLGGVGLENKAWILSLTFPLAL